MSRILIITGEVNSGKTSFLQKLIRYLENDIEINVKGFLAEGLFSNGKKTGFQLKDIQYGNTCLICTESPYKNWEKTGRFYFNPEGINFGNDLLSSPSEESGLFIIDEFGPLELQGKGWYPGMMKRLKDPSGEVILITVRQEILAKVKNLLADHELFVFDIHKADTASLIREITREIH